MQHQPEPYLVRVGEPTYSIYSSVSATPCSIPHVLLLLVRSRPSYKTPTPGCQSIVFYYIDVKEHSAIFNGHLTIIVHNFKNIKKLCIIINIFLRFHRMVPEVWVEQTTCGFSDHRSDRIWATQAYVWREVLESNQFEAGCSRLHSRPDHFPYVLVREEGLKPSSQGPQPCILIR